MPMPGPRNGGVAIESDGRALATDRSGATMVCLMTPSCSRPLGPRSWIALALTFVLFAAACTSSTESGDGVEPTTVNVVDSVPTDASILDSGVRRGGVLRVMLQDDPTPIVGWTPWDHVCAWACRNVLGGVLETLAVHRFDGTVVPFLAESIEPNETLNEWTVTLRDDVVFSDGTRLLATGVKTAHDDLLKSGKITQGLLRDARIISVLAPDDLTLIYELSEPNAGLPDALTGPIGRMFSVESALTDPAGFLRGPVGSGPFVFDSWAVGDQAVMAQNPTYWRSDADGEPLPYLDGVVFTQMQDEDDRLEEVRQGTADVLQTRAARTIEQAVDLELVVFRRVEDNAGVLLFNTLEPPFDDQRVRRALALATDQQQLIAAAGDSGLTPRATQWWGPDSRWYSQRAEDAWVTQDIAEAQRLLGSYIDDETRSDELDPGLPIEVKLQCTDDLRLTNMAREAERQWEAVGLAEVEVEVISRSGLIQRVVGAVSDRPAFSGDFDVTCWRVGGESEPWAQLSAALGPVKTSPLNFANIEDERMAELVGILQTVETDVTRRSAVEEIMVTIAAETPLIYLGYSSSAIVARTNVQGLQPWLLPDGTEIVGQQGGVGHFDEVWIDG